jgi:hypothetical protein
MRKQRIDGIDSERDVEWDEVLMLRSSALKLIDEYQGVLRYNSLTTSQQTDLSRFRQELLDITNWPTANMAADNYPDTPLWMSES